MLSSERTCPFLTWMIVKIFVGEEVKRCKQSNCQRESLSTRQIVEAAGLTVVMNRYMGATHGLLGLGPGPHASTGA